MGNNVQKLRKNKGWTAQELADKINYSLSLLTKIENGERALTNDLVKKLSNIFNVPAWDLSDDEDYIFSKKSLEKILKISVSFGGDISNNGNFMAGHQSDISNLNSTPLESKLDDYEIELLTIFKDLSIKDKISFMNNSYKFIDDLHKKT